MPSPLKSHATLAKLRWLFTKPFQVVAVATILWGFFILVTDFFEFAAAVAELAGELQLAEPGERQRQPDAGLHGPDPGLHLGQVPAEAQARVRKRRGPGHRLERLLPALEGGLQPRVVRPRMAQEPGQVRVPAQLVERGGGRDLPLAAQARILPGRQPTLIVRRRRGAAPEREAEERGRVESDHG